MAKLYLSQCAKVFKRDNQYIVSFKRLNASKNAHLYQYLYDVGVGYKDRDHFFWRHNIIDIIELYSLLLKRVESDLVIDIYADSICIKDVKNAIIGDMPIKRGNLLKAILKGEI